MGQRYVLVCVALLAGTIGSCARGTSSPQSASTDTAPAAVVSLDPMAVSVGTVRDGDSIGPIRWRFRNLGRALDHLAVQATCGCTRATLSATRLEPGATGELEALISRKAEGPFRVSIRISEGGAPLMETVVTGILVADVHLAVLRCSRTTSGGLDLALAYAAREAPGAPPGITAQGVDGADVELELLAVSEWVEWSPDSSADGSPPAKRLWRAKVLIAPEDLERAPCRRFKVHSGSASTHVDLDVWQFEVDT